MYPIWDRVIQSRRPIDPDAWEPSSKDVHVQDWTNGQRAGFLTIYERCVYPSVVVRFHDRDGNVVRAA